ncbi:MAG: stage II sporulation protein D [Clostridia bacterium]|nr:stage II sporulation protein D [Clostridia bacterium]
MRVNLIICIIIALALILCPVAALGSTPEDDAVTEVFAESAESIAKEEKYISVMSSSTGKIERVGMREYVVGCVAAEMPAEYHTEALKAQAAACYTYAKKTCEQNEKHKDSDLGDADITDSHETHQGYLSKNLRKEKWGEKFNEYEAKITAAVDEVFGYYLTYNGKTALAVYHAISAGTTQSAETLWGSEIPYLVSVESAGDRLSPDYISTYKFSENEFKKAAKECGAKLSGDSEEWIKKTEKDDSGYVTSVTLGAQKISASKIREKFNLRSLCFDIDYSDGEFVFTCYGYGHGVGMSQYGADYMARQGFSWREILEHYYPGTELTSVE